MTTPPITFAHRYPTLFHVTDRAALPSIRTHGLCPAATLCDHLAIPEPRRATLLDQNRDNYADLAPGISLRRQGMRDAPLARRLAPGLTPAAWRRRINGRVFLFATEADARRLQSTEPGRDQLILTFATASLVAAGLDLHACRHNNGYMDRRSLADPRLRSPADDIPIADWPTREPNRTPKEVTVSGTIPPALCLQHI